MESVTKMTAAYNGEILRLSSDHLITRTTPQCTHVLIRNPHYQILHVLYSTFWELNSVFIAMQMDVADKFILYHLSKIMLLKVTW